MVDLDKHAQFRVAVDEIAQHFLKLEKYVNLNFTGFHKILKKHDRHLPNPSKAFYISRLQNQTWVRGDYSDILVAISRIHSRLRRGHTPANSHSNTEVRYRQCITLDDSHSAGRSCLGSSGFAPRTSLESSTYSCSTFPSSYTPQLTERPTLSWSTQFSWTTRPWRSTTLFSRTRRPLLCDFDGMVQALRNELISKECGGLPTMSRAA